MRVRQKIGVGILFAIQKESLSIIATIVLVYFPSAAFIFYDAACNFFASIVNRITWFTEGMKFLIDIFHKMCHTCSVTFCPETEKGAWSSEFNPRTSNIESINNQLGGIR